ncbi:hypothetical protein BJV82DRAFT_186922 [Fennellomyces sp. T-0311]|nr:hypothetical protein BJV82DRAFT_186922 [Fennellomyces sp. T-0311]
MQESANPPLNLARPPVHIVQNIKKCDYKVGNPPLDMRHIAMIETKIIEINKGVNCGSYAVVWYDRIHTALIATHIGDSVSNLHLHLLAIQAVLKARPTNESIGFVCRCPQVVALFNGDTVHERHKERVAPLAEKILNTIHKRSGRVQAVSVKQTFAHPDIRKARVVGKRALKVMCV